ncbi:PilZ domain-containing protein [Chelatococcus sambhunathii]|uniref:PilZ domain-containing protein n=1 Tax=Chelatococcus sambhunathii TaxID=363953 RepID=A0ABU1DJS5_9HYPH|nr:PilZ domain-containing protein [Chelatococcus sambhunathii]MDR4308371.1 PilZ domain-containing protein [Chelatococcus sambhunathii]
MFSLKVPLSDERRRHQRVKVALLGRYMLSSRREYPCQTVDMSPGGLALIAPVPAQPGERVVVYLDHVGRVEGHMVRAIPNGFAMSVSATIRKRDKLAAQLTWLTNRNMLGLPEDRRHERVAPKNPRAVLVTEDGVQSEVRIIDVSLSGAAVMTSLDLPIGTPVMLGKTAARVVRHFENGIAVEFARTQNAEQLSEQFG